MPEAPHVPLLTRRSLMAHPRHCIRPRSPRPGHGRRGRGRAGDPNAPSRRENVAPGSGAGGSGVAARAAAARRPAGTPAGGRERPPGPSGSCHWRLGAGIRPSRRQWPPALKVLGSRESGPQDAARGERPKHTHRLIGLHRERESQYSSRAIFTDGPRRRFFFSVRRGTSVAALAGPEGPDSARNRQAESAAETETLFLRPHVRGGPRMGRKNRLEKGGRRRPLTVCMARWR